MRQLDPDYRAWCPVCQKPIYSQDSAVLALHHTPDLVRVRLVHVHCRPVWPLEEIPQ